MRRTILAAIAATALSTGALAQQGHSHGDQGPHGGKMQDVVGIHAELLVAERTLTVHLYDEAGKPVPSAGYTASALVGSGGSRQVVQLAPGAENTMTGTATSPVARGTSVTLQVRNSAGRSGQARF
jgi:nitrogen fixation protein FixH